MSTETQPVRYWRISSNPRVGTYTRTGHRKVVPHLMLATSAGNASPYPVLIPLPDDKWRLAEDWNCEYDGNKYTVPAGFITDGASVPKLLWTIYGFPMEYPYPYSSTLHDYLYATGSKINPDPRCDLRKQADMAFRDYNMQLGMSKFKAYTEYYMLRWLGGSHWNDEV